MGEKRQGGESPRTNILNNVIMKANTLYTDKNKNNLTPHKKKKCTKQNLTIKTCYSHQACPISEAGSAGSYGWSILLRLQSPSGVLRKDALFLLRKWKTT